MSASTKSSRRRLPRWLKLLIALALAVGLYAALGFLVAPAVVKSQLVKRLPAFTQREARVKGVEMNPFALTLTLRGLELVDPDGGLFAAFDVLHVDLELASFWQGRLLLRDVTVQVPYLQVVRRADGTLDVLDLVSSADTNAPPSAPPKALIQRLRVLNGGFHFEDQTLTNAFTTRIQPVHLFATNLSTLPGTNATFRLEATSNAGERVELAGELTLLPEPKIRGSVRALVPRLNHYAGYVAQAAGVVLEEGGLGVNAEFAAAVTSTGLSATVTNTAVELNGLGVRNPDETEPWITLAGLTISGASADLASERTAVEAIALDGASVHLVRRPDGSVNAERVHLPDAVAEAIQNLPDWKAGVGVLTLTNAAVVFTDEGLAEPATIGVQEVWLAVNDFSNAAEHPFTLHTGLRWLTDGRVTIDAEGQLIPTLLSASLRWEALDIRPAQPYLDPLAHVVLKSGRLGGSLDLQAELGRTNAPMAQAKGHVEVTDFVATEALHQRDFLEFEQVRLSGIDAGAFPHSAVAEELLVKGLRTSLVLMTNGLFNVQALVKESSSGASEPAEAALEPTEPAADVTSSIPSVRLGTLKLADVSLEAADQSIPGGFKTMVETVSGTIHGLAWPEMRELTIDLAGRLAEPTPFAVRGAVLPDPAALKAEVTVECSAADLRQFAPYSARFVGHPITEGAATVTVRYRLDGRQVQGENLIHLDDLAFGDKQDSPDAVNLPVKLGVSLLKDRNGRITFDVPISGTLDDPEFSIGKVLSQTVQNLITRAATAPFRMLGSLFGGGKEEDIEYVEFDAGESRLKPSALSKLRTLGNALFERPQLRVAIIGGAAADTDADPLRQAMLEAELRQLHSAVVGGIVETDPTSPLSRLAASERAAALLCAYTNRFGVPVAVQTSVGPANATEVNTSPTPDSGITEEVAPSPKTAEPPSLSETQPVPSPVTRRPSLHGAALLMELAARDRRRATTAEGAGSEPAASMEPRTEPVSPATPDAPAPAIPASEGQGAATATPSLALPTMEEMEAKVLKSIEVTTADLDTLRAARAEAVRKQLLEDGRVAAGRIRVRAAGSEKVGSLPRVTFELE